MSIACEVYIVGAARTPIGSLQGGLSHLSATDLGATAIQAALERAGVPASAVAEVLMGNVCSAGLGQAPARQAAIKAGLPEEAVCTTVNSVCASGAKTVCLGAQSIALGRADVVVAGGMESMSNIPFLCKSMRSGARMGDVVLTDALVSDCLWDSFNDIHMGECAEVCATKHGIDRRQQDEHAIASGTRALHATSQGLFALEIVPVRGPRNVVEPIRSDEPLAKFKPEKLPQLRPCFVREGGTVTAGNASGIADGAAAVVLASRAAVQAHGLRALARIVAYADSAHAPIDFPTAPASAIDRALTAAGLSRGDVDFFEINEAFSVVDLANRKLLDLDDSKVNVFGGAVALGHPIGASGCRILVTLLNVLNQRNGRYGVAAVCNGGGGATAIVVERVGQQK